MSDESAFDKGSLLRKKGVDFFRVYDELCFNCQFCGDTRSRFYLNNTSGLGYCHNCEWAGPLEAFVSRLTGFNDEVVWNMLHTAKKQARFATKLNLKNNEQPVRISLPEGFTLLEQPIDESNKLFWRYMSKTRNIPIQTTLEYGVGYTRVGYHKWRVVIPVRFRGEMVSWVARTIVNNAPKSLKALTPVGNKQSEYLLNMDRLWGQSEVVLVEGPFDMLKIPDLAVASFGKRLSHEQMMMLVNSGAKHVIICYDNDASKQRDQTAERISELFPRCSVVELPPGEDPGSLPASVTRDLVRHAKPYKMRRY